MIRRALILSLLTVAAISAAYQTTPRYDLATLGTSLDGFYALEGHDAGAFRWTNGQALVRFDGIGARAYRLTLNVSGPRPDGLELPAVRVLVNNGELGSFKATRANVAYSLTAPAASVGLAGSLEVQIVSDTFVPPNDLRTLGVGLYALRVEPAEGSPPTWPTLPALLSGVVAVCALLLATAKIQAARPVRLVADWEPAVVLLAQVCLGLVMARVLTALLLPWLALAMLTAYAGIRLRERASRLETAAALAVGLSLLRFALDFLDLFRISRFTDVATMFEAARKLAQGLDPYDYAVLRDNPLYAHSYVYPPSFAQFLGLFLPLGMQGAIATWVVLNFALYFVVLAGLLRAFNLRPRSPGMYALLLVAFNYQPVVDTLFGGQLDVLILALLLLALVLAQRGKLVPSGAALALAAMTKLHPALVLPFYLARERWRGFAGFGLALAGIVLVSALLAPPDLYGRYLTVVLPGRGGESTGNPENQSLSGFLYRAQGLSWTDTPTPEQAALSRLWSYGASALFSAATLGAMGLSLYRAREHKLSAGETALHFSLWVVLLLLVLPTSWMHYETQLLLPLAALLPIALAPNRRGLLVAWAIAAALTAFANQEIFRGGDFDAWPLNLVQSYKLYGVLLLWAALARTLTARDNSAVPP